MVVPCVADQGGHAPAPCAADKGGPVRGPSRWPVRGRSRPIAADQGGPVRGAFFGDSFVLVLLASAIIRLYLFLARQTQL